MTDIKDKIKQIETWYKANDYKDKKVLRWSFNLQNIITGSIMAARLRGGIVPFIDKLSKLSFWSATIIGDRLIRLIYIGKIILPDYKLLRLRHKREEALEIMFKLSQRPKTYPYVRKKYQSKTPVVDAVNRTEIDEKISIFEDSHNHQKMADRDNKIKKIETWYESIEYANKKVAQRPLHPYLQNIITGGIMVARIRGGIVPFIDKLPKLLFWSATIIGDSLIRSRKLRKLVHLSLYIINSKQEAIIPRNYDDLNTLQDYLDLRLMLPRHTHEEAMEILFKISQHQKSYQSKTPVVDAVKRTEIAEKIPTFEESHNLSKFLSWEDIQKDLEHKE